MGSTRLPGKIMLPIHEGITVIAHVIKQLKQSKFCDQIIVATTINKEDDIIIEFLKKNSILHFRGSSDDCLDRYYQCAKSFLASTIVRITCDNPLIDPTLIDDAIQLFRSGQYDYVTNCKPRSFPQGTEVEVFSFDALEKAWKKAKKPSEREHVTPYFYNNPNEFKIFNITNKENLSNRRWTVDRPEDLEFVRAIVLKIKKSPILMKDILELLEKEPNLIKINDNYIMDEGYKKSIENDKKNI